MRYLVWGAVIIFSSLLNNIFSTYSDLDFAAGPQETEPFTLYLLAKYYARGLGVKV